MIIKKIKLEKFVFQKYFLLILLEKLIINFLHYVRLINKLMS